MLIRWASTTAKARVLPESPRREVCLNYYWDNFENAVILLPLSALVGGDLSLLFLKRDSARSKTAETSYRTPKSVLPRLLSKPVHYLFLAAALHVLVALAVFLIGRFQLLPNTIDAHGIGISYAIDGLTYRSLAIDSADILRTNGIAEWVSTPLPFHARLYSLSFAAFGNLLGYNILTAEPLNVLFYVCIISVVYLLGRQVFDSRAGMIAATIVAVWPSFLLHSVQMIRDPLAILCLLAVLLGMTLLLTQKLTIRQGLALGVGLAILLGVFWMVRGNMWTVAVAVVALTVFFLLLRIFLERKVLAGNWLTIVLVAGVAAVVP